LKKFSVLVVALLFVVLLTCVAGAAEEGERIEISFKVGDEILKINGEDVKVEKPVVINGVTLVPLRVITEAFGAEVNWDGQQRCVTLNYSQVTIKLYIDKKEAYVDGVAIELLEAPRIINDRTMVPLRFITENFGADVDYDDKTKQITVVKETANENSIKDFSLILKKTTKDKVGDSYYGWSMNFPKNLNLRYRSFNGNLNIFADKDGNYSIMLSILQSDKITIDNLLSFALSSVKDDYTLMKQEKGEGYAKVVYRDRIFAYEDRYYIKDGKIYYLNLIFEDYNIYKSDQDIQRLLDSFSVKFVNDGSIEDLSDVTEKGVRPYTNKNLKYSIDVLADWAEIKYEGTENTVDFVDNLGNSVCINMFSYDKGLSLDEVVKKEIDYIKKEYNPKMYSLVSTKDVLIDGKKAKELLYKFSNGDMTEYLMDIFVLGENYKYNIRCSFTEETYNDIKSREKILDMMYSFRFEEPDFDEIGYMLDTRFLGIEESYRTVESTRYKWSMELPSTWEPSQNNNGTSLVEYINDDGYMCVTLSTLEGVSFNEYINQFIDKISQSSKVSGITVNSIEDVTAKGTNAKKFNVTLKEGTYVFEQSIYVFGKNGNVYCVFLTVESFRASENNKKILERIWESMKFQ